MDLNAITHDFIGIAPCGCVVVVMYDMGDDWTAEEVAEMVRSGYKVERVPVAEAVARLTQRRTR